MIKIYKLVTGEEVVGEVTQENDALVVKNPCAIMLIASRSSPDSHSMALVPYAGYTMGHTIKIKMDKLVWDADPAEELYNQYNMIFGSGIQIVPGQLSKTNSQTPQVNVT